MLDEAGAVPIDETDDQLAIDAAIDAEVDQFRAFLDELDPTDFIDTTATEATSGGTTGTDEDDGEADGTATDGPPDDIN